MCRAFPVFAALAAMLLSLSGCSSTAPLVPKSVQTVPLSLDNPTPVVSLPVITAVKFILPGPTPTSGYSWIVVSNNGHTLAQTQDIVYTPDTTRPDGGSSSAVFFGLKPGRSVVRFVLIKPSERIAVPIERFTVVVLIKDTDAQ